MQLSERKFHHDGLTMHYYVLGKGKPLLFLHGGALHALTYKRNIESLARYYTVYAPDMPAFGKSETPNTIWTFEDFAAFLHAFIQKEALQDIMVVGHSFGGGVGVYLAAKNKAVTRLVLTDASGMSGGRTLLSIFFLYFARDLKDFRDPRNLRTLGILAKDFIGSFFQKFFSIPQIAQIFKESLKGKFSGKVSVPTLILWGSGDIVHPVKDAYAFHKALPNSKVVIIEGGHDWCLFQPETLTEYILSFDKDVNKR